MSLSLSLYLLSPSLSLSVSLSHSLSLSLSLSLCASPNNYLSSAFITLLHLSSCIFVIIFCPLHSLSLPPTLLALGILRLISFSIFSLHFLCHLSVFCFLLQAYAGARFTGRLLEAINGKKDVIECSFVENTLTAAPFFSTPVSVE